MSRYRKLTTICAAVVLSLGLAACGGGGGSGPQSQGPNLTPAQNAAAAAAEAAGKAADDAEAAVEAQTANKDADVPNYTRAQDAAKDARAAATAATAASSAAKAATTLADAQAAQDTAEAEQAKAMAAQTAAEGYADKVRMAKADDDAATHTAQLGAANSAVNALTSAVGALTAMSSDGDVDAAKGLITAAETAVAAGTMLTDSEKADLNGKISSAKTNLETVEGLIAIRKDRDTANDVARLFGEASAATTKAANASEAAVQAGKDATEYAGKLDVMSVLGESKTARENAQKVLDAEESAKQAVIDATAARTAAQDAKTEATALPDSAVRKSELVSALDAAIAAADADIETAADIRDSKTPSDSKDTMSTLKTAVQAVIGTDSKNVETPTDRGDDVANRVDSAISATGIDRTANVDQARRNEALPSTLSAGEKSVSRDDDSSGMTWAQIVGDANVITTRTDLVGSNTVKTVKAMSIDGATLSDYTDTAPTGTGEGSKFAATQNGIPGTMFCAGADCKVGTGDGAKLTGSWYFTPTNPTTPYITGATQGTYVADTLYATFGHWIDMRDDDTDDTTPDVFRINVYAVGAAGNQQFGSFGRNPNVDGLNDGGATYKGDAAGMSVHKVYDANRKQTSIESGSFTAEVELTAKFDDNTPSLSGTIDNFQGEGTDSDWSVELRTPSTQFDSGGSAANNTGVSNGALFTDGATRTPGAIDGTWTANTYGREATVTGANAGTYKLQPDGIFGTFNANFRDGSAIGAYATKKQ